MQPRLELVLPVQPLHLYRHLLREATYLPTICRPFVYGRIRAGFDRSTDAIATARRKVPPPTGLDDPKTKALHHGLRQLRGLRAVNLGDYKRLDRLLHHVFGRAGKRRRELLAPLLQPSAPRDSEELQRQLLDKQGAPLVDKLGRPLRMRRPDGWDRRKILTYVDSQRAQQKNTSPTDWGRIGTQSAYSLKADDGRLPSFDAYGKPINQRRKRKVLERWWKSAATKMAPPVEKTEWEKIKAAATGELPDNDWKLAPRRTIARSSETPAAETKWDWTSLASRSASLVNRPVIRQQWRLTGKQETGPYGFQRPQRDALPARTVQRAYERIWNTTSYIEQNPETLNSKAIHWGGERGLDSQLPVATAMEARIFGSGEAAESTARVSYRIMKFSRGDRDESVAGLSRRAYDRQQKAKLVSEGEASGSPEGRQPPEKEVSRSEVRRQAPFKEVSRSREGKQAPEKEVPRSQDDRLALVRGPSRSPQKMEFEEVFSKVFGQSTFSARAPPSRTPAERPRRKNPSQTSPRAANRGRSSFF